MICSWSLRFFSKKLTIETSRIWIKLLCLHHWGVIIDATMSRGKLSVSRAKSQSGKKNTSSTEVQVSITGNLMDAAFTWECPNPIWFHQQHTVELNTDRYFMLCTCGYPGAHSCEYSRQTFFVIKSMSNSSPEMFQWWRTLETACAAGTACRYDRRTDLFAACFPEGRWGSRYQPSLGGEALQFGTCA